MTKEEVKYYLDNVNGKNIKLGLKAVTALMEALKWPDDQLEIVHITGTNGKGSVSSMMRYMLQAQGYRVGTYNSPYFEIPNECIRINGEMISDECLMNYMNQIEPILEDLNRQGILPSGFEILTALALLYFKDQKVDYVLLEVGLGGRLDATNVIKKSSLSIITKIAMDHNDFLGNTLEAISREKAGIIKKDGLVLMPKQEANIMEVIKHQCHVQNASIEIIDYTKVQDIIVAEEEVSFKYQNQIYHLGVSGKYQAYNATLAIEAVKLLAKKQGRTFKQEEVDKGLRDVKWPGRFEKVKASPLCFIDGAHNVDGVKALADTLSLLPKRKTIAIIGLLRDKDVDAMLEYITPYIDTFVVTKPLNPRAMEPEVLAQKIRKYNKKVYIKNTIESAVEIAFHLAKLEEEIQILGFGSLYMLGRLRGLLINS